MNALCGKLVKRVIVALWGAMKGVLAARDKHNIVLLTNYTDARVGKNWPMMGGRHECSVWRAVWACK